MAGTFNFEHFGLTLRTRTLTVVRLLSLIRKNQILRVQLALCDGVLGIIKSFVGFSLDFTYPPSAFELLSTPQDHKMMHGLPGEDAGFVGPTDLSSQLIHLHRSTSDADLVFNLNLRGSVVVGGSFYDCNFTGCDLTNTVFCGTRFLDCSGHATLSGTVFQNCTFDSCDSWWLDQWTTVEGGTPVKFVQCEYADSLGTIYVDEIIDYAQMLVDFAAARQIVILE